MAVVPSIRVRAQTRPKVRIRVTPALIPANATIEIGDVTTLPPGSVATVVDVGTPGHAIFDIGLPRGASGTIQTVVAGANVSVNATDPANPIVSATSAEVQIHAAVAKVTPADLDEFGIADSAAAFILKKLSWANLKEGIRGFLYLANKVTPADGDPVGILDSATSFSPKYSTFAQIKAFLAASATPLGNAAVAVVGTATTFARADHVHPGREVLTVARTYYVRSDGSDSNTGLANTSGAAFLTIQKAVDTVCSLDLSTYQATIQIADATYTGAVALGRWVGTLPPIIQGNSGTPANVLISVTGNSCFTNDGGPTWIVKDLKVQTTTTGRGLYATFGGTIYFTNIDFGLCAQQQMLADGAGKIRATGNFAVSGSALSLAQGAAGFVDISVRTVTFSGTVNYTNGTIVANRSGGNVDCFSMTFTNGGIVTGARYAASANGTITVAGAVATYLPGNAVGTVVTGGQYA